MREWHDGVSWDGCWVNTGRLGRCVIVNRSGGVLQNLAFFDTGGWVGMTGGA